MGRSRPIEPPSDYAFPESETPAHMHRQEGGRQVEPSAAVETAGRVGGRKGEAKEVDGKRKCREHAHHGQKKKGAQPGKQQAGRRDVAGLEGGRVQPRDVRLTATVATVLTKKIRHGLAALPADLQLWIEEQLATVPPDAIVELEILVGEQPLVPATELARERGGIGAERDVVHRPDAATVVVGGVADAKGRSEERRVGKECRCRRWRDEEKKKRDSSEVSSRVTYKDRV